MLLGHDGVEIFEPAHTGQRLSHPPITGQPCLVA
jgi:hypothetical protein